MSRSFWAFMGNSLEFVISNFFSQPSHRNFFGTGNHMPLGLTSQEAQEAWCQTLVATSTLRLARHGSFHSFSMLTHEHHLDSILFCFGTQFPGIRDTRCQLLGPLSMALELMYLFNHVEKHLCFWLDIFLSNVDFLRFSIYRFLFGGNIPTSMKVEKMTLKALWLSNICLQKTINS